MKTFSTLAAAALLLLAGTTARATVRIVDNNVNSATPYSVIDSAIKASAPGDTVYVQASPTSYGNVNIDRRITLIGAGYDITGTQHNLNSKVSGITLDSTVVFGPVAPRGTKIIGLDISTISASQADNISGVSIERCRVSSISVTNSSWRVVNCIVGNLYMSPSSGPVSGGHYTFISNNIFYASISGFGNTMTGVVITNNFFKTSGSFISNTWNTVISNNIFWFNSASNPFSSTTNSTFSNNLAFGTSALTLPPAGNSGGSNMSNTNPQFVNVPLSSTFSTTNIPTYNFGFQTGSPAINAGSDGTNIGPSGGGYPMSVFTGAPQIPQMQELNILNPVVNLNQPLNINFKARKMN